MAKVSFGAKTPSAATTAATAPAAPANTTEAAAPASPKRTLKKAQVPGATAPTPPTPPTPPVTVDVAATVVESTQATPATQPAKPAAPAVQVPAKREATAISLYNEGVEDIDMEDLVLPRVNLAQRVGELGEVFEPGTIVLGKSQAIGSPEAATRTLFLGKLKTRYVTGPPKGKGMGEIVTEAEFRESGGTTSREEAENSGAPLFQKLISFAIFVRKPDGEDDSQFPYVYDTAGEPDYLLGSWALARISFKGGSYINVAKPILSARKMGKLSKGYSTQVFELGCEDVLYKKTGNKAFSFKLGVSRPTTEGFRKWVCAAMSVARDTEETGDDAGGE